MKQIVPFLILIALLFSCKKKGCTYPEANNYNPEAQKDDGSCDYTDLSPDPRTKYVGSYLVTDSAFINNSFYELQDYTLQVSFDNTVSDTLFLKNLWNDGLSYIVILSGDSFSMPAQQVSGPYYASGSGSIIDGKIEYNTSGDAYLNIGRGEKQ